MNIPLPDNFTNRSLWEDAGILQYRLDGLAGHILVAESGKPFQRKQQILKDNYSLAQVTLEGGAVYQSKIDSRAAGGASATIPLLSFASKLETDQTMEIVVTDTTMIFIDAKDVPTEKLITEASKPNPNKLRRVWVQAVMLTQVVKRLHTKVDADATVTGSTFGANGRVFNEAGIFQRDPKITMLLVDLDDFAHRIGDPAFASRDRRTLERALTQSHLPAIVHIAPETLK